MMELYKITMHASIFLRN